MSEHWGALLDGVYLSGGDGSRFPSQLRGFLTAPPDGLGLPEMTVDDYTPLASDGTVRDAGFYPGRVITLTLTVGGRDCDIATVRRRVSDIAAAWTRRCESVDLSIFAPPMVSGTPWDIAGPYVVRGKPRQALVSWRRGKNVIADLTLRFDGDDWLLGQADEDGVRVYDCYDVPIEVLDSTMCYAPTMCYDTSISPPSPDALDNLGNACVPILLTFTGDFPSQATVEVTSAFSPLRTIYFAGVTGSTGPITLDTSTGRAYNTDGDDFTGLFSGDTRAAIAPGQSHLRLRTVAAVTGTVQACANSGVVSA